MSKKISTYTDTGKYRKKKPESSPSLVEIRKLQAQARFNPSGDENASPVRSDSKTRAVDIQKLKSSNVLSTTITGITNSKNRAIDIKTLKNSNVLSTELTGISNSSSVVAISAIDNKVHIHIGYNIT